SSLWAPEEKLVVVPNGTDIPTHTEARRQTGGTGDDKLRLISVSNLVSTKGVQFNIEAIANLARTRSAQALSYTIIGDGPERRKLEKMVVACGLDDRETR
ncbi:MAG: glycosyltransferase involved in cell wall biosynthesis, partial [Rhodothermales bacterium]